MAPPARLRLLGSFGAEGASDLDHAAFAGPMTRPAGLRALSAARRRATMTEFKIGQYVNYVPRRAEGRYVVMKLLPQAKGEPRATSSEARKTRSASTQPMQASFAGFLARGKRQSPRSGA
jgi:hypothetical protein